MIGLDQIVLVARDFEHCVFQCTRCSETWEVREGDAAHNHECPKQDEEEFAWLDD